MPPHRPLAHRPPATVKTKQSGVLSPAEWATIIVAEASKLGYSMNRRQVAEALGVLEAESSFNASSKPAGNDHIGAWAEEPGFGSEADRLDPVASTAAALKRWKADGQSFWPAWGKWEKGESEGPGPSRYKKFLKVAEQALGGNASGGGSPAAPHAEGGHRPSSSSPWMRFLLTGALVLGGLGLTGLGTMRAVGSRKKALSGAA